MLMTVSSCTTMKPEGTARAIVTGDVFSGSEVEDPGPVDYTAVEQRTVKPPVRWKMEF